MPARATSATVKRLAGNPGKRPLKADPPAPVGVLGAPPAWLTADGLDEWARVSSAMVDVLTAADYSALVGHCCAFADVVQAGRRGEPMKSSMLTALRMSAAELGLSPASRVRLATPATGAAHDPAEEFFEARPVLVR